METTFYFTFSCFLHIFRLTLDIPIDIMAAKRSLSIILDKLCKTGYLMQKRPSQYCLGTHGLVLKKNIINSMSFGRTDLITVSDIKSATKQLKKSVSAITLDHEKQDILLNQKAEKKFVKTKNMIHSWEILKDVNNDAFAYQEYFRRRRIFWKKIMFNQDHLITNELEGSKAKITANLKDLRVQGESQNEDVIEIETLEMLEEDYGLKNCKIFHSVLDPNAGTMAVLMDATMRFRQFCQTSRLSLPMKIAPIPLGILVRVGKRNENDEINETLLDLARFIEHLLTMEKIDVLKNYDYQTFDDLGVPYVIVIDETCLDNGIIKIRDRETDWYEQIHLAHLAQRMVKTFQDREIPDAYKLVKKKYNQE